MQRFVDVVLLDMAVYFLQVARVPLGHSLLEKGHTLRKINSHLFSEQHSRAATQFRRGEAHFNLTAPHMDPNKTVDGVCILIHLEA